MKLENRKSGEREDRPTPETDAECFVNEGDFVTGEFARRLERERDEAMGKMAELQRNGFIPSADIGPTREIMRQRDRLLAAFEALLAGDFRDEAWEFAHAVVAEIKGSAS